MATEITKQPSREPTKGKPSVWDSHRKEISLPGYWSSLSENCEQWADDVSVSPFWKQFERNRSSWSNEFYQTRSGALLARDELPKFCGKKHPRIRSKLEKLLIDRPDIAMEYIPTVGPPVPRLNDLVRTRVECAFLDGVEFMGDKLQQLAESMNISISRDRQGRLEGYFAQHLIFEHQVYFRMGGVAQPVTIKCEIQLATQLATRIWEQSHIVYEEWRGKNEQQIDWQWNPKDPRFISRQLGHMIHLADGLLVQLRDARLRDRI